MDLCAATLEELVWGHMDDDIEIAGRAAVPAFLAFSRQAQARPVIDPGRDFDREFFGQLHHADTTTLRAGVGNPHAFPATGRTGGAQSKKPLTPLDLPQATTRVTGHRTRARGGALSQTVDTGLELLKFQ